MANVSIYFVILVAGVLQAFGNPMNAQLKESLQNPWLASLISFLLIVPIFLLVLAIQPRPLPTLAGLESMPWWAPFGGIVGAVAVVAGLMFVGQVGTGTVAALLISANLITSLAVDHFGWLGVPPHPASGGRLAGAVLMILGVAAISLF